MEKKFHVFLKLSDIKFANSPRNDVCGVQFPSVYIGDVILDEKKQSTLLRDASRRTQKQNASFVQRARNNIVIRNGDKRYRMNGAGIR